MPRAAFRGQVNVAQMAIYCSLEQFGAAELVEDKVPTDGALVLLGFGHSGLIGESDDWHDPAESQAESCEAEGTKMTPKGSMVWPCVEYWKGMRMR